MVVLGCYLTRFAKIPSLLCSRWGNCQRNEGFCSQICWDVMLCRYFLRCNEVLLLSPVHARSASSETFFAPLRNCPPRQAKEGERNGRKNENSPPLLLPSALCFFLPFSLLLARQVGANRFHSPLRSNPCELISKLYNAWKRQVYVANLLSLTLICWSTEWSKKVLLSLSTRLMGGVSADLSEWDLFSWSCSAATDIWRGQMQWMVGYSKIYTVLPVQPCISISCAILIHLTWCGNCAGGAGGGTTFSAAGFRGCSWRREISVWHQFQAEVVF